MREIIFKAKIKWNGDHFFSGCWIEGFYFYDENEDKHYIKHTEKDDFGNIIRIVDVEVNPKTVSQFTGLTDKNGVKIFEGDEVSRSGRWKFTVRWSNKKTSFVIFSKEPLERPLESQLTNRLEVIGNIHDEVKNENK